jgi:hypothetical protein
LQQSLFSLVVEVVHHNVLVVEVVEMVFLDLRILDRRLDLQIPDHRPDLQILDRRYDSVHCCGLVRYESLNRCYENCHLRSHDENFHGGSYYCDHCCCGHRHRRQIYP